MSDLAEKIKKETEGLGPVEALTLVSDIFRDKIVFSTS
ncbi:MAG TPA: phosphoadenylyl-sulfate reductase, partial [Mucilaginibacter sp.]|nr:phosphoadenylyl-sulfate reductase [Mucilaginibacter sp.]